MHYLLLYDFTPDYLGRRGVYREAHLRMAWAAQGRGELILGGALTDPADAGVLLFKIDSPRVAEEFAAADPYVINGLVARWRVRQWNTVVGEQATAPVRPG